MAQRIGSAALAGLLGGLLLASSACVGPKPFCGDGIVQQGEQCDDGNFVDGDGCNADCTLSCTADSDCDDQNPCNGAEACTNHGCAAGTPPADGTSCGTDMICRAAMCVASTCGDGVVQSGEQCDEGADSAVCANCMLVNPPSGTPISATELTWKYVPIQGAVCRDGSDTGIMVNLNSASDKVMLYLEGGGACFDPITCGNNPPSFDPSGFDRSSGIFDRTDAANPVKDWNFVYIPYCTGDVHAGDVANTVTGVNDMNGNPVVQQFRGYSNITLDLNRIVPTFPNATQVLLAGVSAGGFGAASNAEHVQRAFWNVPMVLLDDSGPPMSSTYIAPCLQDQWRALWGFDSTILRDCGADCPDPTDYVLDLTAHLVKRYPTKVGGLISNTQDTTIRFFYGFGADNCTNVAQMAPDLFQMGLDDFRTFIQTKTSDFGTYYIDGTSHTCIGGSCFGTANAGGTPLTQWVSDLLSGTASQVGP